MDYMRGNLYIVRNIRSNGLQKELRKILKEFCFTHFTNMCSYGTMPLKERRKFPIVEQPEDLTPCDVHDLRRLALTEDESEQVKALLALSSEEDVT